MEGLEEVEQIEEQHPEAPKPDAAKPAEKPDDKPKPTAAEREARRELKAARELAAENERAAQYWKGRSEGATAKAPKPEPEEDVKLSVDLVEAISGGDAKSIKKALDELGFVSKKEMERTIASTRAKMTEEAKIIGKHPDLADEESELFQETSKIYNEYSRGNPELGKSSQFAQLAAELAKTRLAARDGAPKPATKPKGRDIDDDDEDEEETPESRESDRLRRVGAQQGDRGRRGRAEIEGDDADELSSQQKSIVEKLREAGGNITEEGYKKRAKAGVRMGGAPVRRDRR